MVTALFFVIGVLFTGAFILFIIARIGENWKARKKEK